VTGSLGGGGLGVVGCGISNALVNWFALACGTIFVVFGRSLAPYRLLAALAIAPARRAPRSGASGAADGVLQFVEILILYADRTLCRAAWCHGGCRPSHRRPIWRPSATCCRCLWPLPRWRRSGRRRVARDWRRARVSVLSGLLLAGGLGNAAWRRALAERGGTGDGLYQRSGVRVVSLALIIYVVVYQVFDALQTLAAFALRGYKITFVPMFVHIFCFWGIALFGGWWLAFRLDTPMGVTGFWLALTGESGACGLAAGWIAVAGGISGTYIGRRSGSPVNRRSCVRITVRS